MVTFGSFSAAAVLRSSGISEIRESLCHRPNGTPGDSWKSMFRTSNSGLGEGDSEVVVFPKIMIMKINKSLDCIFH